MSEQNFVASQYAPRAAAYVQSQVHASGADLDEMAKLLEQLKPAKALDLGCGGGHVSYRAAPYVQQLVACDITSSMLEIVAQEAKTRNLPNIETIQAPAEALPFANASFDTVLCRFTAHHWADFSAGIRQARRVIKPGSTAIFIDTIAPARRVLDTHIQAIELLRDPSHVRNYSLAEWSATLADAGFALQNCIVRPLRMVFAVWTERTKTPANMAEAIIRLQQGAPPAVKDYFDITPDGSFNLDVAMMVVKAL